MTTRATLCAMRGRYWQGWSWLVAAGVAATIAWPITARQPLDPPALLAGVLKARPEWRLLDPAVDLVGDYTVAQLEALDRWPPWIEGDFDKDGRNDIAGVVVRRGAGTGAESEFTVVALRAASPGRAELVVPFGTQRILGVADQFEDGTVTPLYCVDCDANVWYRWNGRSYEPRFHAVGESLLIGGEPGRRLRLFADPQPDAIRTTELSQCARAQVLQVGGREGARWYRVEVDAPRSPRGWVPQQLVMPDADCGV